MIAHPGHRSNRWAADGVLVDAQHRAADAWGCRTERIPAAMLGRLYLRVRGREDALMMTPVRLLWALMRLVGGWEKASFCSSLG